MPSSKNRRTRWLIPLSILSIAALGSGAALATNGMYLTGYGTEAAGRGGANLAVADRALGLQANPAGIAQMMGHHFTFDIQLLMPEMRYYNDPLGNDIDAKDQTFVMPSFSYVRGGETKWTWGIGVVSQGGMGATFEGYRTPFGTVDDTSSEVRFGAVVPAVAYRFNDDVSIGLSANLGWSDVEFSFYPETSFYDDGDTPMDPSDDQGFPGSQMTERATAFNYSFRFGVMWRASRGLQFGAVYQTKTQGDYEDGTLTMNFSQFPGVMQKVNYDASVDGFTWPEQYGIGVQFRPGEKWVVALDVKRYNWSDAVDKITVVGTNPDATVPPFPDFQQPELPFTFEWKDQWVAAVGMEYRISDAFTLRAGFNHGDSPVPDATLNPLFPATVEDHLAVGFGWNIGSWTANFAYEHAFENTQTNLNDDQMVNPFGPGMTIDHSQNTISIGFSKAFARKSKRGGGM